MNRVPGAQRGWPIVWLLWIRLLAGGLPAWADPPEKPAAPSAELQATLSSRPEAGPQPTVHLLSGARLRVRVQAAAGARVTWRLAHERVALREGRLTADADGRGEFVLSVPAVRCRTACVLVLADGDGAARRQVVLFPAGVLGQAAERLKVLRVGVSDPRRLLHAAVAAEGIPADDLNGRLAADHFTGGLVVLAGHANPTRLTALIQSMLGRVRGGMCLLILNPPAGWQCSGFRRREAADPPRGSPALAKGLGAAFDVVDLGTGPWHAVLGSAKPRTPLIRLAKAAASRPSDPHADPPVLAAARQIGAGLVVAALLPQLETPDADAVGRMVMDEMILWILRRQDAPRAEKGQ